MNTTNRGGAAWVQAAARATVIVGLFGLAGWAAYWIGSRLSSDAIGMLLGLLFGILAALPGTLLVLVANRRAADRADRYYAGPPLYSPPPALPAGRVLVVLPGGRRALLLEDGGEEE